MSLIIPPSKFLSRRCFVREAQHTDTDALHDFFNRANCEYTREELGWDVEEISKKDTKYCIRYFKRHAKNTNNGKTYYVFRKGDQKVIGTIDITHDREHNIRVNFYIHSEHRNSGFGTEVHASVIRQLRKIYPKRQIIAEVETYNKASQKLLLRNGFRPIGMANSRFTNGNEVYKNKLIIFRSQFTP